MLYKNDQDAYAKDARKGSKALYFGKSREENVCSAVICAKYLWRADAQTQETWVPLIEKAYAKLHGDYASLEGQQETSEHGLDKILTLFYRRIYERSSGRPDRVSRLLS